jgi:HAD superfamily hydrolase (TIGR01509 family)
MRYKNPNGRKRLLMFDVGGVIINYNQRLHYTIMAERLGVDPEAFINEADKLTTRMEVGSISLRDSKRILSKKFRVAASSIEWIDSFKELARPNPEVVKLVNDLHKDFRIAITTNIERFIYRIVFGDNGMLRKLTYDKVFASCYMRVSKPSKTYYSNVLDTMKVAPENALFVDDNKLNIAGAAALGINTVFFKGNGSITDIKRALGRYNY